MIDFTATTDMIEHACVAHRTVREVVIVTGEEAASYLHGQVSQGVTGLAVGASTRSLVLSPQGRIDAWTRITRVDESTFWLDVEPGFGSALLDRLQRFKLRTKADFSLESMAMISVRGPQSPPAAAPRPEQIDAPVLWGEVAGFDRIGHDIEPPEGVVVGDAAAFETLRIRSGMPSMAREVAEKTIPAELGIVDVSVDFTKGCYVGQELVARVDSRGNNTPRRLWGVRLDEGFVEPGESISMGDDVVGTITSSSTTADGGAVALASIVRAADVPGAAQVGLLPAQIVPLPMFD